MDDRKKTILQAIVREYIQTAEPVSSQILTDKYAFDVSPATIRNDMVSLEREGYILQPHTSAGRIPTEKGYQFYIQDSMHSEQQISKKEQGLLKSQIRPTQSRDDAIRNLAKGLANLSLETVIIGFGPREIFTAGLANLFRQPEFEQHELVEHIGSMIDGLDAVMEQLAEDFDQDVAVLVGRENPFGRELGTIVARYLARDHDGLLCILGPIRMNYRDNLARLQYSRELISQL